MNCITNRIIIRNLSNLAKKNKLKSNEWKRIGSIDVKLQSISNKTNIKKKQNKKKNENKIKFSDYDYYRLF